MDVVASFAGPLEELERERRKVQRDRRGFLFVALLAKLLALVCFASAAIGGSTFLALVGFFLIAGSIVALAMREHVDGRYQMLFRDKVTRHWFHQRFLGVFLAAPPKEPSPEALYLLREAGLDPAKLEDRIYFDRETEDSHVYVATKGLRRHLYFMKKRPGAVPTLTSEFPSALEKFGDVHVRESAEGLWVWVRLKRRLFEAPVTRETTDPAAYVDWVDDAKILLDPDVRLHWIAAR